jgi:hypothetical protein
LRLGRRRPARQEPRPSRLASQKQVEEQVPRAGLETLDERGQEPFFQSDRWRVGDEVEYLVIGAGGNVTGAGGGQIVIDDLTPDEGLTSVTLTAFEDESGTAANWGLRAWAICAVAPSGLERVAASSPSDSTTEKFVPANCPLGKQVIGAGGDITAGVAEGEIVIDDLVPSPGLTNVIVRGIEDESLTTEPWSVTAYAICAI